MASSQPLHVLVVGAGELGRPVLENLLTHPFVRGGKARVSVLLRPSSVKTFLQREEGTTLANAAPIAVDLESILVPELSEVFFRHGVDVVIGCTGFVSGGQVQRKLAQAVLDAKVKLYVPWQFGVDYDRIGRGSPQDLFDEQLDVRDMLRAQEETASIIISTGMFTSFLFEPWFGVVEPSPDASGTTVRALGSWDTEVTVTAPQDIGRLTAAILLNPNGAVPSLVLQKGSPRHQIVYVAGDTISYGGLADIVQRLQKGRPVHREIWTVEHLKSDVIRYPRDSIKKYRAVFAQGVGVAWDKTSSFNVRNGIDVEDVEEWAAKHYRS